MVAEVLRKRFRPCEPIVLSYMKWMKLKSGALRQTFKRLSDKGIVRRYMNGVYYLPEKEKVPSVEAVVGRMYVENGEEIFGYYSGYAYAGKLCLTDKKDKWPVIVTNKENSRGRFREVAGNKVYLKKPYTDITKNNVEILALLDFIREWEMYSDLSETETFSQIKKFIKKHRINRGLMSEIAVCYPAKVSAMILKYRLV